MAKWLWRFSSTPANELPAWAQNPGLFTGKYVSAAGFPTSQAAINGQPVSPFIQAHPSGKVTNGFLKALCRAKMIYNGADSDGYGSNADFSIAEYTDNVTFEGNVVGFGEKIAVAYSPKDGAFLASKAGKMVDINKMGSAPFFLSLFGFLLTKTIFSDAFSTFVNAQNDDEICSAACLLANITYYETENMLMCEKNKIARLSDTKAASAGLMPLSYVGNFSLFSKSNVRSVKNKTNKITTTDSFVGAYKFFDDSEISEKQKALIPKIDSRYIVGEYAIRICEHIKMSTGRKRPIRNILLRGEPGVGKSELYVGVAAGCGLPLYTFAANAMTEPFDMFGQYVPVDEDGKTSGEKVSIDSILKNMPTVEDMTMDPVLAYQSLTGLYKPDATSLDCMSASFQMAEMSLNGPSSQPKFKFIPGQLVYALKDGGVWGFDEVTLPQNSGVVPALNPAMDSTQSITLPTGEIINRHPLCIFIGTTNIDLEGCRRMNQAWQDRCQLIIDIEEPNDNELIARVKAMTDFDDAVDGSIVDVPLFVRAYKEIKDLAKKKHLDDGIVGPRKLADWILSTLITKDAFLSATMTIIPGATADERGISELREKLAELL